MVLEMRIYCSRLCGIFKICRHLKFTFDFLNKNYIVTVFYLYSVIFQECIYDILFYYVPFEYAKNRNDEIIST